jgi:2-polyprenyl-3-methyl-5-hydroxy-6-metoxy-1,4-benzoquinol methylase
MNPISETLRQHYSEKFALHGASSQGVDWGANEANVLLRYQKMLEVIKHPEGRPSLLDVGCGYGGLLSYANDKKIELDYTGIDVAENMIEWARANQAGGIFTVGDVMHHEFEGQFDYVVCNGILTQKLDTTNLAMDQFAAQLIKRMFSLCKVGIVFNVMTTKVNYFSNNLYYRNPAELFSWCLSEISSHIRLDHSYPLFEYTLQIYREPI